MPLPVDNSSARFTLFAGEPSLRTSKLGIASPTFTKAGRVEWKPLEVAETRPDRAVRVRGRRLDLNAIVTENGRDLCDGYGNKN